MKSTLLFVTVILLSTAGSATAGLLPLEGGLDSEVGWTSGQTWTSLLESYNDKKPKKKDLEWVAQEVILHPDLDQYIIKADEVREEDWMTLSVQKHPFPAYLGTSFQAMHAEFTSSVPELSSMTLLLFGSLIIARTPRRYKWKW